MRVSFGAAAERNAGGQLREARNFPDSLISQNPENPDFLCNLGLCYVDLGQLDKGIELFAPLPARRAPPLQRLRVPGHSLSE